MTDKSGFNLSKQGANIVRKEFRRQLVLLAMGSAMVPFSGAMAQSDESGITAEQSRASSAHSGASQPAIVVTARRKEESILETPLAVSAFSADDIADAGLQDFNDIFLFAPGVYNSNVTGRSDRITIRGVSQVSTTGGASTFPGRLPRWNWIIWSVSRSSKVLKVHSSGAERSLVQLTM